jgi:hypothetical protein
MAITLHWVMAIVLATLVEDLISQNDFLFRVFADVHKWLSYPLRGPVAVARALRAISAGPVERVQAMPARR